VNGAVGGTLALPGVKAVIVISQDGNITCWRSCDNTFENTTIKTLPLGATKFPSAEKLDKYIKKAQ
jgi:hypothetical protein